MDSNSKKVLVTGGGHSEIPLILAAKELGMYVITTGNNPEGDGHRIADKYIQGDFSDRNFVRELAEKENVSFIVSGCNDFAYISAAYTCEQLGLPGHDSYETAKRFHNKDSFREEMQLAGCQTPIFKICRDMSEVSEICSYIPFPVIVKPVDLTGGKGVRKCMTPEEVTESCREAFKRTREERILIEQFVSGSNHGTSMLIRDKKVIFSFFDNEHYGSNKYLVAGTNHPSTLTEEQKCNLIHAVESIAERMQLKDGLFHTQYIVTQEGSPVIIDPCRRTPGDFYPYFVKYSTGYDIAKQIVLAECGMEMNPPDELKCEYITRHCVMAGKKGIYSGIEIAPEIAAHKENIVWDYELVPEDTPIESKETFKAAIFILRAESEKQNMHYMNDFDNLIRCKVRS